MSQSTGSSSDASSRERTIPIQIEGDKSKPNLRSSSRLAAKKGEEKTPSKSPVNEEVMNIISEDSSSADESGVCASVKSLSLSPEKQRSDISEDLLSAETIMNVPQRLLPSFNVPEKIIIVFDRALDDNYTSFELTSGKKYSSLFMFQHALKIFLHNKSVIDNQHEFALVLLNENSAMWLHDFTNLPSDIIRSMQSITECEPEDIFDLNAVFDLILKNVEMNTTKKDLTIPHFIVRTLLLYGRSYSIPQLTRTEQITKLLDSPYFTVDVVMTHEPPSSANHCDKIFKALQEIDTKGYAYSFSVSRNASDLHVAMAKMLSHPLQRPHQQHANYKLKSFE